MDRAAPARGGGALLLSAMSEISPAPSFAPAPV
jgi:hypothetical protein